MTCWQTAGLDNPLETGIDPKVTPLELERMLDNAAFVHLVHVTLD